MWPVAGLGLGEIAVLPLVVRYVGQSRPAPEPRKGGGSSTHLLAQAGLFFPVCLHVLIFHLSFCNLISFLYLLCYLLHAVPLSSVLEGNLLPGDVDAHHIWGTTSLKEGPFGQRHVRVTIYTHVLKSPLHVVIEPNQRNTEIPRKLCPD